MEIQPLISIIVPVYGVEKYINQCIKSIVYQTYKNLEIILVDDGSPDKCPEICDEWAKKDSRIKVIHKENGGQADARNVGLSVAKGDYIGFVDADDYIDLNLYTVLLNLILDTKSDISVCNFVEVDEGELNPITSNSNGQIEELSSTEALKELIHYKKIKGVVWDKLYKKSVVTEPFVVDKACEDTFWIYKIIGKCEKVVVTSYIGYFYQQRSDSTTGIYRVEFLDSIEARRDRLHYLEQGYPELVYDARRELFYHCLNQYQRALIYTTDKKKLKNILLFIIKQMKEENLFDYSVMYSFKDKIWVGLARFSLSFACKTRNALRIGL